MGLYLVRNSHDAIGCKMRISATRLRTYPFTHLQLSCHTSSVEQSLANWIAGESG
jgi:hypothetical protein